MLLLLLMLMPLLLLLLLIMLPLLLLLLLLVLVLLVLVHPLLLLLPLIFIRRYATLPCLLIAAPMGNTRCTPQVIVEWRALTVCLLDEVAGALRQKLGKTAEDFPLVKVCAERKLPLLIEEHVRCCFG